MKVKEIKNESAFKHYFCKAKKFKRDKGKFD